MKRNNIADNINFSINREIVCQIISKAKELHAKEGVTFPEEIEGSQDEYDWLQVLADHKDDLTFQEVQKNIEDLEPDQQTDLLALMYVGRGDYDIEDWSQAHKEAKNNLAPHLGKYLLSKPLLSDYLSKGLELLGYTCEE